MEIDFIFEVKPLIDSTSFTGLDTKMELASNLSLLNVAIRKNSSGSIPPPLNSTSSPAAVGITPYLEPPSPGTLTNKALFPGPPKSEVLLR